MSLDSKEKLQKKLQEIFQFDSADLDFGIYKIFNQRKGEITNFIEKTLPEDIEKELKLVSEDEKKKLEKELEELESKINEAAKLLNQIPDLKNNPEYQSILKKIEDVKVSREMQEDIYNHILTFFTRYYDKGDFITTRRYAQKYMIPYSGEETLLHWATSQQYYIKTTANFRKFLFTVNGYTINFKVIDAEEEIGNVKEQKTKYFILNAKNPCEITGREINFNFDFRSLDSKEEEKWKKGEVIQSKKSLPNQDHMNQKNMTDIHAALQKVNKDPKPASTTIFKNIKEVEDAISKNLGKYTRINKSDYFIHKDLKSFLDRELEFYIKNEVWDLQNPILPLFLKGYVIKNISDKIIEFLDQLENFQKGIWEKKKFVLKTDYVFPANKIPKAFRHQILNPNQISDWNDRYGVKIKNENDLTPYLPVDTKYLEPDVKDALLMDLTTNTDLDDLIDGLLINSENYQALNLLIERFRDQAMCIYIDPPYNTGSDDFLYKDNYQHSSWLSLIYDRIKIAYDLLKEEGTIAVSIDINEIDELLKLLDEVFGYENRKYIVSVKGANVSGPKVRNRGPVKLTEYLVIYSKNSEKWKVNSVYKKVSMNNHRYTHYITNIDKNYVGWKIIPLLDAFAKSKKIQKSKLKKELCEKYQSELDKFTMENPNRVCQIVDLDLDDVSDDLKKLQKDSIKYPKKIFHLEREGYMDYYLREGRGIVFLSNKLKMIGGKLEYAEKISDIWTDVQINNLANEGGKVKLKKGKKPESLLDKIIQLTTSEGDLIIDFFAGTGTSAAVAHKTKRKYINVEMADYFSPKLLARMKNTIYGEESGISKSYSWKGGGSFKYHQLEQYEDALENIEFSQTTLSQFSDFFVKYMLYKGTQASQTFLNIDKMEDPFNYKIKILENYQPKEIVIDLIETYNYLIGLKMQKFIIYKNSADNDRKYVVINGKINGSVIIIIWRDIRKLDPTKDRDYIQKNILPRQYDEVHINGSKPIKDSILIEQKFKTMMNGS